MSARKVKRIVLSDEEDGNDADCDEITESASAKKLAESINQLNVLDSAEKINNNKSSRKTLSEEARPKEYAVDGSKQLFYQRGSEEADGSKRQSSSTKSSFTNTNDGRRVSARSQTVTSKKENSRQKALNEMKNIRSRGLDAINFDESDEDAYSEVYDDESEEEEEKAEVLPRRSPKKPADRKKTDYEYSYAPRRSSSSGGTVNRLGPSAHTLKMFSEYRGNHEKEHDTYASDLDDFIVREEEDDEEEEEEEADAGSTDEDEADGEAEFGVAEGAAASQSPVKKKKGSRGKVIAVDEEEDEEEDAPQVSKSTKSRRVRRVLFGSDSEAESAEGDRKAAKNKKKSKQKRKREQTEDDEDDGPMLYWQVNAKMDEEMDDDPDELNAATAGHLFQMRQVSADKYLSFACGYLLFVLYDLCRTSRFSRPSRCTLSCWVASSSVALSRMPSRHVPCPAHASHRSKGLPAKSRIWSAPTANPFWAVQPGNWTFCRSCNVVLFTCVSTMRVKVRDTASMQIIAAMPVDAPQKKHPTSSSCTAPNMMLCASGVRTSGSRRCLQHSIFALREQRHIARATKRTEMVLKVLRMTTRQKKRMRKAERARSSCRPRTRTNNLVPFSSSSTPLAVLMHCINASRRSKARRRIRHRPLLLRLLRPRCRVVKALRRSGVYRTSQRHRVLRWMRDRTARTHKRICHRRMRARRSAELFCFRSLRAKTTMMTELTKKKYGETLSKTAVRKPLRPRRFALVRVSGGTEHYLALLTRQRRVVGSFPCKYAWCVCCRDAVMMPFGIVFL